MAQTVNVNFRLDEADKKRMENVCNELGLSMSAAFTIFAKKVGREHRIPFEVSMDPFYSENNVAHLRRGVTALNAGLGVEHDIIEE
ncbi:addiction module antitoxin, RelB/DinJ family [Lachnoanaerobaculum sp. MSX33]|jgi:addiction module antitoxin, relB/dinJ family|uniref:type II toxin-antitoxin system RelB/DinJ family antitoxin n=1 Tax=unclassified Lachnoanaerobaculum TaxID=2625085 RepID=UPI000282583A|nr:MULTISPECIES: type II toxin-antitoxin system RelB/DinJ family antitoxin [unclassified Lachnoanaerobaculum]EJZ69316.1 RelB/DinJ family addiction module antitoxin [Lachnoanaerobaculum sp. OBRC5-5]ETO99141.1 addiction module antitoxin, RelB/DinJ family [Lachnoanaerobaculum sp. MSX33]MDU6629475.1 type II toxin-antitoxin system RelB/DinJ family antitoxin [Lachnoanaerobaculum sp.]